MSYNGHQFSTLMGWIELVILVLFGLYTTVDIATAYSHNEYVIFRDIMVMLLLGFGYLMTFLRKYGLGAVGFTMLLTALSLQLNLILEPSLSRFYKNDDTSQKIPLTIASFIDGEFSAATLLISFGAVIGRTNPTQLVVMALFQSIFYAINKVIFVFGLIGAEDVGGTLTIHMFGAYFGLAVSKACGAPAASSIENSKPNTVSDILSLIGTTLLWVYWPSFVGATETSVDSYERYCVIHTILALLGSTAATFFLSPKLRHGLLDPVHIANSTLAGGVAIGASARMNITPIGALLVGVIVGCVSVYGYVNISPALEEKINLYDTCGVHNLHGLPSVVGGLASIIFVSMNSDAEFLLHKDVYKQELCQFLGVVSTILFAIVSGYMTGLAMVMFAPMDEGPEYDDSVSWEVDYFGKDFSAVLDAENDKIKFASETTPLM